VTTEDFSESLIFLISQPRAGSTLLQRILGSHPDVHTVAEPWLMLHPIYALRDRGCEAEYDAKKAQSALMNFLQILPEAEEAYLEGIRRMYGHLYRRALDESGKRYFLDKTPRYYSILPELLQVFPKAHYIILFRNPLAVMTSVLTTWTRENWFLLHRCKADLLRAPCLLLGGLDSLGEQGIVVHYEALVREPDAEMKRICAGLRLEYTPEMIEYGRSSLDRWGFGDQGQVYESVRPAAGGADKWIQALDDPQTWRLVNEYLERLSCETIQQMGYAYDGFQQVMKAHQPAQSHLRFTFSLDYLLSKPTDKRARWEHLKVQVLRSLQRNGWLSTAGTIIRRTLGTLFMFV
jgi:hypothetical protein